MIGFKNLKVRINAAVALASPTCRNHYGRFFLPVWISLFKALENSQHVDDFNEYKHRDNLIEQVGTTYICLGIPNIMLQLGFKPTGGSWVYQNTEIIINKLMGKGSNPNWGFFD